MARTTSPIATPGPHKSDVLATQKDVAVRRTASANPVARRHPYSFQTALPYIHRPEADFPGPGRAWRPVDTEVVQFEFMRHWERVMLSNA